MEDDARFTIDNEGYEDKYEEVATAYPFPSLLKRPCNRVTAEFSYGPQVCGVLTRRRVWLPLFGVWAMAVDCGAHNNS